MCLVTLGPVLPGILVTVLIRINNDIEFMTNIALQRTASQWRHNAIMLMCMISTINTKSTNCDLTQQIDWKNASLNLVYFLQVM